MSRPARKVSILCYLSQRKIEKTYRYSVFVESYLQGGFKKNFNLLLYLYTRFLKFSKQASQSSFPLREALHISLAKGQKCRQRTTIWTASASTPAPYLYFAAKFFIRNETLIAHISETGHLPVVKFCKKATSTIIFCYVKK